MRMRRKPWARPELDASDFFVKEPTKVKGHWNELFKNDKRPLHLEIGCGKGNFVCKWIQNICAILLAASPSPYGLTALAIFW